MQSLAPGSEPAPRGQRKKPSLVCEGPLVSGTQVFQLVVTLVVLALLSAICWMTALKSGALNLQSLFLAALGAGVTFLFILTISISWVEIKQDRAKRAQKKTWLKNAVAAQAVIVERKEEYDPYGESVEQAWQHHLALRLPPSAFPNSQPPVVWARVNSATYDRAAQSSTVNIYYAPTDPYLFLIEGE